MVLSFVAPNSLMSIAMQKRCLIHKATHLMVLIQMLPYMFLLLLWIAIRQLHLGTGLTRLWPLPPEETGIDELKGENGKVKTAVYDLSGRRVQKGQKGVFIQNGKVMVR